MQRIIIYLLLILFAGIVAAQNRELSVNDFRFDGPLGCEGATISKVGKNHFKIVPGHAPDHPNWPNMIQFEITGNAKGNSLRLDVDFPVSDATYHYDDYFNSCSYDGINWTPVFWRDYQHTDSRRSNVMLFPAFKENVVFVGHQVPMSYERLEVMIKQWENHPAVKVHVLGKSLEGRNIYRLSVSNQSIKNKKWVHYFTNQHPGEHNAQWRMAGMMNWLLEPVNSSYLDESINHFVFMMSPDGPSNGWYRTNAQGVDGNRSYFHKGADNKKQAHEAYICQKDLEGIMRSENPVTDIWSMHTWQGVVEPILIPGPEIGSKVAEWNTLRELILSNDENLLIEPLRVNDEPENGNKAYWTYGPHAQFGITSVLCEGAGSFYSKEHNISSGKVLMKSIAEYYR